MSAGRSDGVSSPDASGSGPRDDDAPALFVDSHCHLTMDAFDADREEVLSRARAAGVRRLLVVSSTVGDSDRTVAFARAHEGVLASVGVHPHVAAEYTDAVEEALREALADPRVVAIGEIGLDYHYDRSPRPIQQEVFRRQIRLARGHRLPVVIHTRSAPADTLRILEEEGAPEVGGVFHCFSEGKAVADWAVENGYLVSFSGILTFRNAEDLRACAAAVPLERTLIETDAPYLAPVPMRGRRNEPAFVKRVAACLGEIHGLDTKEVGRITSGNFDGLFGAGEAAAR